MARIVIGDYAVVSQGAHLCCGTHDLADPGFALMAKPIVVGARVWVAAEAFIGPGIALGDGCVVGARAVVFKNVPDWAVVVGNPARAIKMRALRGAAS